MEDKIESAVVRLSAALKRAGLPGDIESAARSMMNERGIERASQIADDVNRLTDEQLDLLAAFGALRAIVKIALE